MADALGMPAVIVPPRAGALSAVGLLASPRRRELVRSWATPGDRAGLDAARRALWPPTRPPLVGPGAVVESALDCRYAGQSHELTVARRRRVPRRAQRRNGYARADVAIEVVASGPARPGLRRWPSRTSPRPRRPTVAGPRVVAEPDCTVWVPDGWAARPGPLGAWVLQRDGAGR